MDSPIWFDIINFEWSIVYISRGHRLKFPDEIVCVFPFLKIAFVFANSVDPDEMPHYVAFHLALHCLPKYIFRSHWYSRG